MSTAPGKEKTPATGEPMTSGFREHATTTAPTPPEQGQTCPQLTLTVQWMRCGPRARREFLGDIRSTHAELWRQVESDFTHRMDSMKGEVAK